MKTAKVIPLYPSTDPGNAAMREIKSRAPYEPMTHIEIGEAEIAASKERAWRFVTFLILTASAFTTLWAISFIVGLVFG